MSIQDVPLEIDQAPPAPPHPTEAGGLLTIDLAAIETNWRILSRITGATECSAVVKADAYGCGLEPVAARLAKAGCKTFFVTDLAEARRVRMVARDAVVYVLNGILPNTAPAFAKTNVRPVINSLAELAEWEAFVACTHWRGGAALHVDTGMNRLGLSPDEATEVAARLRSTNHGLALMMSHLACADTPEHPMNERQIRSFRELRGLFPGVPASLANSSGIYLSNGATHWDLVRPGVALFGGNPTPGQSNPMHAVVELKAHVVQTRSVQSGDAVGYGATFVAPRPTRVAVVAIGYADGLMRSAAIGKNKAAALVTFAGKRCPILGQVSMDLFAVDVTDLPEGGPCRGDLVTLIGGDLGVDEVAASFGTISYEVLTSLGRRHHRQYQG
jgi:alanine racemase